jgi:uncharacterized protein (TIGR02328 family)
MRLWHKDLISALPREQLIAQWRELSAIAGNILTKGTPNHLLVNKIMEYPFDHFITYAAAIREEMTKRGYRTMDSVWKKITSVANNDYNIIPIEEIYTKWMNFEYFMICYMNLREKFLCNGITQKDWDNIHQVYTNYVYNTYYGINDGVIFHEPTIFNSIN